MQLLKISPLSVRRAHASLAGALVCAAISAGCVDAGEPLNPLADPTAPTAPTEPGKPVAIPGSGIIAGFVIGESGECIIGARVELVDGPNAGAVSIQTLCDIYNYEGGYYFNGLPAAIPLTVRVTAEGYESVETRSTPTKFWSYPSMIVLTRHR